MSTPSKLVASSAGPVPFFLDTRHGRLFAVHHRPAENQHVRGHVLCVPPFNEEMNRCRSMITLQAQSLASEGIGTLLIDLHGTGDSSGDYADARWSVWLDDVCAATNWLDAQPGGCLAVWGIRLGALLAAESLRNGTRSEKALIVWQPVVDGKQYFTQFLRMRIAAQMDRPNLPKETTSSMRAQLAAGQAIEIAGYAIHPELSAAIDGVRLADVAPPADTEVLWLEHSASTVTEPLPVSKAGLEDWRKAGVVVKMTMFEGPTFWQLHERVLAKNAIEATTAWAREKWSCT